MIKKLRRKFIMVAMLAVAAVLFVIIGIINIVSYASVNDSADKKLAMLAENGGSFFLPTPPAQPGEEENESAQDDRERPSLPADAYEGRSGFNVETPFEVRYFSVTYENGEATSVDLTRIAAVDEEQARAYASTVRKKSAQKGYVNEYRYLKTTIDGKETYLFLDCSRDLSTFYEFLLYSFVISAAGLVVVFILVFFFSKIVTKPVAESYEKQKRFITDASHELKTPLTIISANTEILEMDEGENEWTDSIKNQVKRLTEMTNNLVYLSRMEEEDPRLFTTDFSLTDLVNNTLAPYDALALTQNKTLVADVEEGVQFHGDEKAIKQALTMLLDNAVKYSDENGKVWVEAKRGQKGIRISVKNTVEEMSVGDHAELFERFARSDKSRNSKTGGSGIGMAVAQAVVQAHGGKISAVCPDEKTFVVTIEL